MINGIYKTIVWDSFAIGGMTIILFTASVSLFFGIMKLIKKIPYIKKVFCSHEYHAEDIYCCDFFHPDRMVFRCKKCRYEITVPIHEIRTLVKEFDEN